MDIPAPCNSTPEELAFAWAALGILGATLLFLIVVIVAALVADRKDARDAARYRR